MATSSRGNSVAVLFLLTLACAVCPTDGRADGKRGFGGGDSDNGGEKVTAANSSWYYNWSANANSGEYLTAEFVPMFWAGWAVNENNLNRIANDPNVEYVLGFNEPERPDQANMTVAGAITRWTQMQSLSTAGKVLVSPAVSDTVDGRLWLTNFMAAADAANLVVDEVAFHWYGSVNPNNPVSSANSFLNKVDQYHNTYNRPVWITEFGGIDWGGNYDTATMNEANRIFLDRVVDGLEQRDHVTRYAWWNWNADTSLFAGNNPTTPTSVGESWVETIYDPGETHSFDTDGALGYDVAYLRGGTLSSLSSSPDEAINYLDAIEAQSTLSLGAPIELSEGWARVRVGATLVKTGFGDFQLTNATLTNNGTIQIQTGRVAIGGEMEVAGSGTFEIGSRGALALSSTSRRGGPVLPQSFDMNGGVIVAENSAHAISGTINVPVATNFDGPGQLELTGDLTGTGPIAKRGEGVLRLASNSTHSGAVSVEAGSLWIDGLDQGTSSFASFEVSPGASVTGSGAIASDQATVGGTLEPSLATAAALEFDSDLVLQDTAMVVIGNAASLTGNRVAASGQATLDGGLVVEQAGEPLQEDAAIEVLHAVGGVVGEFDEATLPDGSGALAWRVQYTADRVYLAAATSLAGDFNTDGVVDAADYSVWRDAQGQAGLGLLADANGDAAVDTDDLGSWRANYGRTLDSMAIAVPEPATVMLLLLSLTAACYKKQ